MFGTTGVGDSTAVTIPRSGRYQWMIVKNVAWELRKFDNIPGENSIISDD